MNDTRQEQSTITNQARMKRITARDDVDHTIAVIERVVQDATGHEALGFDFDTCRVLMEAGVDNGDGGGHVEAAWSCEAPANGVAGRY